MRVGAASRPPGWNARAAGTVSGSRFPPDEAVRRRLIRRFGPEVTGWLDGLPALADRLARRWNIRIGEFASPGNTSCVYFCGRPDGKAVLKLTPDPELALAEASALDAWKTSGRVPQVLCFDEETGALLLESIEPGTPLRAAPAAVPPAEISALVRDLHAATNEETIAGFPSLAGRVEFIFAFYGTLLREGKVTALVPRDLLRNSLAVARGLAARPGRRVLLHGDLHAGNVLDGGEERGLVAVDPRACAGDPAFDLIDWVLVEGLEARQWPGRAERLAAGAGVDPDALWRWCGCTAVLIAIGRIHRGNGSTDYVESLLALAAGASLPGGEA